MNGKLSQNCIAGKQVTILQNQTKSMYNVEHQNLYNDEKNIFLSAT